MEKKGIIYQGLTVFLAALYELMSGILCTGPVITMATLTELEEGEGYTH